MPSRCALSGNYDSYLGKHEIKFKTHEAEGSDFQDLFLSDDELSEGGHPQCRQSDPEYNVAVVIDGS